LNGGRLRLGGRDDLIGHILLIALSSASEEGRDGGASEVAADFAGATLEVVELGEDWRVGVGVGDAAGREGRERHQGERSR